MEATIREVLINWIEIKEKIPRENGDKDPFYIEKLELLYSGEESLGENKYKEWSKEIDAHAAYDFTQYPSMLDKKSNSLEILTMFIHVYASSELSKAERARAVPGNELDDIIETAYTALRHTVEHLGLFSSEYLIWHFDERSNDDTPGYSQVAQCLSIIEELYEPAINGIFKHDLKPFLNLCEAAFRTIHHGGWAVFKETHGSQNRHAAKMRHKKSQDTKRYAISLYKQKAWKSKKDAAKRIHNEVKAYGETIGWLWNDDFQAHDTIYNWILAYTKMNK